MESILAFLVAFILQSPSLHQPPGHCLNIEKPPTGRVCLKPSTTISWSGDLNNQYMTSPFSLETNQREEKK